MLRFGGYLCGFFLHLIGRETINIPEIFSGVHGFTGTTVKDSRLSKTMKTASTVCATQCLIANTKHCRPCRILWPFILAVLLEIFYKTIQKDTGKLKSFL